MIHLTKGNTEIFTTTCDCGDEPLYYFKFTNRTTSDVVEMWLNNLSTKSRFQKFQFDTDDFFGNFNEGFWTYTIQVGVTENVVPTTAILESGYMYLHPEVDYEPIKYSEQSNNFTAYNG